jgi:catechol 2,3-dioxygenase-like lactoylglutathione lyase family enzyme
VALAIEAIRALDLTTADAPRLSRFYCEAFGFHESGIRELAGPAWQRLFGLAHGDARQIDLVLGEQRLTLTSFQMPGSSYPSDIRADDVRFQHFAIVVADMAKAYARLARCSGWLPITHAGPQQLPASSGAVSAFKFRDPEGHPLELLAFAPGSWPDVWRRVRRASGDALCLGIDHSAISVASTTRSIDFYQQLGFRMAGSSLNHGEEQSRLDALCAPIVEVTALVPLPGEGSPASAGGTPHLELLSYRSRPAGDVTLPARSNDLAATRVVLETQELRALLAQVGQPGGIVSLPEGHEASLIHDPDGHALLLWQPRR